MRWKGWEEKCGYGKISTEPSSMPSWSPAWSTEAQFETKGEKIAKPFFFVPVLELPHKVNIGLQSPTKINDYAY